MKFEIVVRMHHCPTHLHSTNFLFLQRWRNFHAPKNQQGWIRQLLPLLLLFCFLLQSCSSPPPRISARAELAGQQINTTVDSRIAKYYLENYLKGNKKNPEFDDRINRIYQIQGDAILDRQYLQRISKETSVDLATLYLTQKILDNQKNYQFYLNFREELSTIKARIESGKSYLNANSSSYIFLFVPGWVYKSQPSNGANFAKPRRILTQVGLENYLIEIEETGTIEENAVYLAKEIARYNQMNKPIILASASSGGPTVLHAIGELLEASQLTNVKAWVNIGGILQGSFLADSAVRWPKRWLTQMIFFVKGWNYNSVKSMTTKKSQHRFKQANLPTHVFYLNYAGIPLSGHITNGAKDGYADLRKWGPNDGLTLIADELIPNSVTIPELGLDHFYRHSEIALKTIALSQLVMNYLESSKPVN